MFDMTGFLGGKKEPLVLELDPSLPLPELTGDLRENLKVLGMTAGFQYLLRRLAVQKAGLRATLEDGLSLPSDQKNFLLAGIYWAKWLESELKSLTQNRQTPKPIPLNEREQFEKIQASLELVGIPT